MAGDRKDFLLMVVAAIALDPTTKLPIVMLKDPDNKLNLPIWVGPLEATSMATELECVEVTDLRENTYDAQIQLKTREGRAITIDSRPSDALALALRTKSPIYVAKKVLEASSELESTEAAAPAQSEQNLASVSRDKWSEILERMSPEDFKYKM